MSNLKVLKVVLFILVAILVMSCNSNEPEIGNDNSIIAGSGINENPEPTEDLALEECEKALSLYDVKNYEEALPALQQCIEKYKDNKNVRIELLSVVLRHIELIYEETGRYGEILSMLEEYQQGDSRFAKWARYRTGYYVSYTEAIEIWKGVEFSEEDVYFKQIRLFDLGVAYYQFLGNKEEGYKYFDELIDTYPNCTFANLARVYFPR